MGFSNPLFPSPAASTFWPGMTAVQAMNYSNPYFSPAYRPTSPGMQSPMSHSIEYPTKTPSALGLLASSPVPTQGLRPMPGSPVSIVPLPGNSIDAFRSSPPVKSLVFVEAPTNTGAEPSYSSQSKWGLGILAASALVFGFLYMLGSGRDKPMSQGSSNKSISIETLETQLGDRIFQDLEQPDCHASQKAYERLLKLGVSTELLHKIGNITKITDRLPREAAVKEYKKELGQELLQLLVSEFPQSFRANLYQEEWENARQEFLGVLGVTEEQMAHLRLELEIRKQKERQKERHETLSMNK